MNTWQPTIEEQRLMEHSRKFNNKCWERIAQAEYLAKLARRSTDQPKGEPTHDVPNLA